MTWRRFRIGSLLVLGFIIIIPTVLYLRASDFSRSHTHRVAQLPELDHSAPDGSYRLQIGDSEFLTRVGGLSNDGENIILLHGFPETSIMWQPLLQNAVDSGYRVITYDQRGYSPGARPKGAHNYTAQSIAMDVIDIADAMGMDSFHLVGHDWGSMIAWTTAMSHPDRLLSLTTLSIVHPAVFVDGLLNDPEQQRRSGYMDKLRMPLLPELLFTMNKDKVFDKVRDIWTTEQIAEYRAVFSEPGALTGALNWYRAFDVETAASDPEIHRKIYTPTLFIWGAKDPVISHHLIPKQKQWIDASYDELQLDAGHSLMQEAENEVIEAIMKHISSHLQPRDKVHLN